ncbi:MAG: flagellar protein FliS [Methylacidiphilales bacterium]|nr:flagellar protein FliS [Candidatus Methylacidiphilales bacterium]
MLQTATTDANAHPPAPTVSAAAAAYRTAAVTVAPTTAIVIALDRVLLNLKRTIEATQAKRFDEAFNLTSHSTQILRGLAHHIDVEKGGALAERLQKTYHANNMAMLLTMGKPDAIRRYQKLAEGLTELRDAWAQIARIPPLAGRPSASSDAPTSSAA